MHGSLLELPPLTTKQRLEAYKSVVAVLSEECWEYARKVNDIELLKKDKEYRRKIDTVTILQVRILELEKYLREHPNSL